MKFDIPKIVRPLELSEYAPEFGGATIWVWVNPPRALRQEYQDHAGEIAALVAKLKLSADGEATAEKGKEIFDEIERLTVEGFAWWANIFSQGKDAETHWTGEDVRALVTEMSETDPALWSWVIQGATGLMNDHRALEKKRSNGR